MSFLISIWIGVFTGLSVFAAESPAIKCSSIQTTMELYNCVADNHPAIKGAQLTQDVAKATRESITQWPNPELSVKSVKGDNAGENIGGTEVELSFDVTDLMVKRPSLRKLGQSEEKLIGVEAQEATFLAKSQFIRSLFRYRQLIDELDLVTEALETFQKIETQFRSRRGRGPEQEITLNLVELAQSDYELNKNHLQIEKHEIEASLMGVFGEPFKLKREWLPNRKEVWPDLSGIVVSKQTFELRKIEAEKERAEVSKTLANVESWPQIAAGPVYERTTEGPNRFESYGVNVTVGLPIFSFNKGGRALANANLMKSQYLYDYALRKSDLEIQLLQQKYSSAVHSLKRAMANEALKKKHQNVDSLFRQGLTSGTTVIEIHRQITEFVESQHEHEMSALDSLMYLYALSDRDPSEVLK